MFQMLLCQEKVIPSGKMPSGGEQPPSSWACQGRQPGSSGQSAAFRSACAAPLAPLSCSQDWQPGQCTADPLNEWPVAQGRQIKFSACMQDSIIPRALNCGSCTHPGESAADAMRPARDYRESHQYFFFTYSGSFTSTRSSLSFTRFLAADKSERACRCAHSPLKQMAQQASDDHCRQMVFVRHRPAMSHTAHPDDYETCSAMHVSVSHACHPEHCHMHLMKSTLLGQLNLVVILAEGSTPILCTLYRYPSLLWRYESSGDNALEQLKFTGLLRGHALVSGPESTHAPSQLIE